MVNAMHKHSSLDSRLTAALIDNLRIDHFDEEDISLIVAQIGAMHPDIRQKVLALCNTLSGASSSLVISTLRRIRNAEQVFSLADLERWIGICFDFLDTQGIDAYIRFASQADIPDKLHRFRVPGGVRLKQASLMLETFIRGISGLELKIGVSRDSFTDTSVIYLPDFINRFQDNGRNLTMYKLMTVHKWAQIVCGTLTPDDSLLLPYIPASSVHPDIGTLFRQFAEREFACDLYNCIEAVRIEHFMRTELPGLMREAEGLKAELYRSRPSLNTVPEKAGIVEALYQFYLSGTLKGRHSIIDAGTLLELDLVRTDCSQKRALGLLHHIYGKAMDISGNYVSLDCPEFLGEIKPEQVSRYLAAKRQHKRQLHDGIIKKLLDLPEFEPQRMPESVNREEGQREVEPMKEYLVIKGKVLEVDEDLRNIIEERGGIPGGILVQGSDMGGGRAVTLSDLAEEQEVARAQTGGIKYAEWDYRRGGYRRNYCSLYEHDMRAGYEPFVAITRARYRGQIEILRKKFELLRREPRLLKNQRDGDHVDIDAAVEALADMHAGISPGEGFFVRTDRQERNIVVLFLVDMSGSTKGWVNTAEKESLVLMSEALEALGDRYAIYGFSGFTRTKCDFYRIKSFDDAYTEKVHERIAGIRPMDYTRMGPPIRHALGILHSVEARTKLLLILSDGKPEDWDAYKGEHAIEDTRKALLEVKERGIHAFCITIDREGQTYLPHMFGESRYTVIDDAKKLPARITEIYRRLTT